MKLIKIIALVLSFAVICSLMGCNLQTTVDVDTKTGADEQDIYYPVVGNSSPNLNNLGIAAQYGEWIYFASKMGISREKIDGSETQKLTFIEGGDINVCKEWVYFIGSESNDCYRMTHDGKKLEKFLEDVWQLYIINDYVYYSLILGEDTLYRTDHNKESTIEIIKDSSHHRIFASADRIYWNDYQDTYSCDLDGQDVQLHTGISGQDIIVEDNIVYSSGPIEKQTLDGEVKQTFCLGQNLNVYKEWLYFTDLNKGHDVYRISKKGGTPEKIISGGVYNICIAGDWIFFRSIVNLSGNSYKAGDYYRMHLEGDGTIEKLN